MWGRRGAAREGRAESRRQEPAVPAAAGLRVFANCGRNWFFARELSGGDCSAASLWRRISEVVKTPSHQDNC